MNIIARLFSTFVISICAVTMMSDLVRAQEAPTVPQQETAQRICSSDTVENLLPPPVSEQSSSPLSYLGQQGFTPNPDGSWTCYGNDSRKQGRYYTLFKVQQINGKLVASSFLEGGILVEGQTNRSLDLFMMLIEKHTKTNQGNRESIRRYLEAFFSLVKQGKIQLSNRGYLFDQPSGGVVVYHPVTGGKLKGTAITININSPQNLSSSAV
ncbi:hypothetical protein [Brasilonema sp. UFV-L1]|uniref:hypothetical protein n=1 Tax=Brasilonema sp. UFV-L1 TaxID=2234130 RepID=UPI00145C63A3|nr:hypothetical protein [Brasilonema sp. UFV-L1]NMG08286.1 hypothetical protein [Brasilonema sp. UFV-L1]